MSTRQNKSCLVLTVSAVCPGEGPRLVPAHSADKAAVQLPVSVNHKPGTTLFNISLHLIDMLISSKFKATRPGKINAIFFCNLPFPSSVNPADEITMERGKGAGSPRSF